MVSELRSYQRPTTKELALQVIEHGDPAERRSLLRSIRLARRAGRPGSTLHAPEADCLVDMWVGRQRFAWIDLSAGPFEWGPHVGGVGTRTKRSKPQVPTMAEIKWTRSARKLDKYVA